MEWIPVIHKRLENLQRLYNKQWNEIQDKVAENIEAFAAQQNSTSFLAAPEAELKKNKMKESKGVGVVDQEKKVGRLTSTTKTTEKGGDNISEVVTQIGEPLNFKPKSSTSIVQLVSSIAKQQDFVLQFLGLLQDQAIFPQVWYHVNKPYGPLDQFGNFETIDMESLSTLTSVPSKINMHLVHFNPSRNANKIVLQDYVKQLKDLSPTLPIFILSNQVFTEPYFDHTHNLMIAEGNLTLPKRKSLLSLFNNEIHTNQASGFLSNTESLVPTLILKFNQRKNKDDDR